MIYPTTITAVRTKITQGKDCFIGDYCLVTCGELVMGDGSQINAFSVLSGRGKVNLGKNVVVGYRCNLITSTDTPQGRWMNDASPEAERKIKHGDILVKEGAFVGVGTTIMPGVVIGEFSCVGAGSYIDKSIPRHTIVIPRQELTYRPRADPRTDR